MEHSLISFGAVQNSGFSDTNIVGRVLGDKEGRAAVEEVLQQQKLRAKALLDDNRHLVVALRDALLERHELIGTEITDVLEQAQREHIARGTRSFGAGTTATPVIDLRDQVSSTEAAPAEGSVQAEQSVPAVLPTQATGQRDSRESKVEPAG